MKKDVKRCKWVNLESPLYLDYHDKEWGVPVHEDNKLFEMLILEGAQAGLSWETVLKKEKTTNLLLITLFPKKLQNMMRKNKKRCYKTKALYAIV